MASSTASGTAAATITPAGTPPQHCNSKQLSIHPPPPPPPLRITPTAKIQTASPLRRRVVVPKPTKRPRQLLHQLLPMTHQLPLVVLTTSPHRTQSMRQRRTEAVHRQRQLRRRSLRQLRKKINSSRTAVSRQQLAQLRRLLLLSQLPQLLPLRQQLPPSKHFSFLLHTPGFL